MPIRRDLEIGTFDGSTFATMQPMSSEPILLSGTDCDLPPVVPSGLERYKGFREIARGGNGMLQACYDTITGRVVVIKSLLPDAARDRGERRRLLREARVTAQLEHPNTVPVYDIGDDEKNGVFFVMKRISGENFFEILKRIARGDEATLDAFPISRRLDIIADACQALAYAHARGVIHRDVKPENIWVGNFGEVILLDWGVAKVWGYADNNLVLREPKQQAGRSLRDHESDGRDSQLQTLTSGDQRPGTPLYMSPEQVEGNRGIDERSDIFSVGVCLYEMLALREPFRGANIDETFHNIRNVDVPRPSERSPQREIPAAADEVVMRALQKHPSYRFQSMRDLIAAIRSVV